MRIDVCLTVRKAAGLSSKKRMKAQQVMDKECVRYMKEYVPVAPKRYKRSGALRDSITVPKPGLIRMNGANIRKQYIMPWNHKRSGNPRAQRLWFEVMKKQYTRHILGKVREAMK